MAYVRPEHLSLDVAGNQPGWHARLRHVYLAGSMAHLELHVPSIDQTLEADVASEDVARRGLQAGTELRVLPHGATVFPLDERNGTAIVEERWLWQSRGTLPA
ncbi:MAG TPA: TOBE-like domain-containing protein [Rhodanobacter sp.]